MGKLYMHISDTSNYLLVYMKTNVKNVEWSLENSKKEIILDFSLRRSQKIYFDVGTKRLDMVLTYPLESGVGTMVVFKKIPMSGSWESLAMLQLKP
jgi:hypothetical protein